MIEKVPKVCELLVVVLVFFRAPSTDRDKDPLFIIFQTLTKLGANIRNSRQNFLAGDWIWAWPRGLIAPPFDILRLYGHPVSPTCARFRGEFFLLEDSSDSNQIWHQHDVDMSMTLNCEGVSAILKGVAMAR